MAFQIKKTVELATSGKSFNATETTGVYSATNTTGYNTPNVAVASAFASVVEITKWRDTTTYSVNVYSTLPSSANGVYTVLNTDLGLTSADTIPDGVYFIELITSFAFGVQIIDVAADTITVATSAGDVTGLFIVGATFIAIDLFSVEYTYTIKSVTFDGVNTIVEVEEDLQAPLGLSTMQIVKRSASYELFFANGKACLNNILKQIDVEECADCMNTKIELASKFHIFLLAAEYAASCGKANKATVILNYLNELCDLESCDNC